MESEPVVKVTTTIKMISLLKSLLKKYLFKEKAIPKKVFSFNPHSETVPEAFGYPVSNYQEIVNELSGYLDLGERLVTFDYYLQTNLKKPHNLDINNPNHAAVLGYAFCTAVILQKELKTKMAAKKMLDSFYPERIEAVIH
jgi:hypothetical protein